MVANLHTINAQETKMKKLIVLAMLMSFQVKAEPIKVLVIDTGFDFKSKWTSVNFPKPVLCPKGHKDFTQTGLNDTNGHGTHIAGLIGKYAENSDYCIMVAKFYDKNDNVNNTINSLMAIKYAIDQKVDIINFSGGGNNRLEVECKLITKALDSGIAVVAAAGNYSDNLNRYPFYPAMCDSRVIVVANLDPLNKKLAPTSNYAENVIAVNGTNIVSLMPDNKLGVLSGTSQSTAIYTGKLIKTLNLLKRSK